MYTVLVIYTNYAVRNKLKRVQTTQCAGQTTKMYVFLMQYKITLDIHSSSKQVQYIHKVFNTLSLVLNNSYKKILKNCPSQATKRKTVLQNLM